MASRNLPSCESIAQYWHLHGLVFDLYSPQCFGCSYIHIREEDEKATWNDSGLERAHIVAANVGGCNKNPGNFLLLCERCHRDSPMSNSTEILLEWVRRREHWLVWQFRRMKEELDKLGVTALDFSSSDGPEFVDFIRSLGVSFHILRMGSEFQGAALVPYLLPYAKYRAAKRAAK